MGEGIISGQDLEVAGANVLVYVKDGVLHVSLDLDDVDEALQSPNGCVPICITVGDEVVHAVDGEGTDWGDIPPEQWDRPKTRREVEISVINRLVESLHHCEPHLNPPQIAQVRFETVKDKENDQFDFDPSDGYVTYKNERTSTHLSCEYSKIINDAMDWLNVLSLNANTELVFDLESKTITIFYRLARDHREPTDTN